MLDDLTNEELQEYYILFKKIGKRGMDVKINEYDSKYAMHLVRLLLQCQQVLENGDLDLMKDKELFKSIRRHEWKEQDIKDFFTEKDKYLEKLYQESTLQHSPDEKKIKQLLLDCLEMHFGSLSAVVTIPSDFKAALDEIKTICERMGS